MIAAKNLANSAAIAATMAEISLIPYNEAYELGFEDMHRRIPDTSKVNALIAWAPSLAGRDHR